MKTQPNLILKVFWKRLFQNLKFKILARELMVGFTPEEK